MERSVIAAAESAVRLENGSGRRSVKYRRRSHRPDANQAAIVKGLRSVGAIVFSIGHPVDLMVGYRGRTVLLELKDGNKRASERKLGEAQIEFFKNWTGGSALTVESLDDALKAIGAT